jgi:hypothetical protein
MNLGKSGNLFTKTLQKHNFLVKVLTWKEKINIIYVWLYMEIFFKKVLGLYNWTLCIA